MWTYEICIYGQWFSCVAHWSSAREAGNAADQWLESRAEYSEPALPIRVVQVQKENW